MLPSNFKLIAEYFVIPLLVLLISYAISGQFNLKYSAGTDFFIFFLSADLSRRSHRLQILRLYSGMRSSSFFRNGLRNTSFDNWFIISITAASPDLTF